MIDKFSMIRRVVSRLEKFVFDRVWNEPYMEYRTNTRPRILNGTAKVSAGVDGNGNDLPAVDAYTPASGVLTGAFEQIALPAGGQPYYVYSIENNQFRSIKLNTTTWVSLQEYCTKRLVDLQVYSDGGVFLWRGGIFIKQDEHDARILVAVDAEMLHRCLDVYTKRFETKVSNTGEEYQEEFIELTKRADPSAIFFTKYVDSDLTADNEITCTKVDIEEYINIHDYGINPVSANSTIAFHNGRVITGSSFKNLIKEGDYVESIVDKDVLADLTFDMQSGFTSYTNSSDKQRVLIHIPVAKNPNNYLISYNTCDFYLLPKAITEDRLQMGFVPSNSGIFLHLCDREKYFIQLTHNDFAIDVDFLNGVAAAAGFPDNKYCLHVLVRHHDKKLGLTRDANYCDMLYTQAHNDATIIKFLTDDADLKAKWHMDFWTAKYLEDNGAYARAMNQRVGSNISKATAEECLKPTTDKTYQAGKNYYQMAEADEGDVVWYKYVADEGDPIPEGVSEYIFNGEAPAAISGTVGTELPSGTFEKHKLNGVEKKIDYESTEDGTEMRVLNQCSTCKIADRCTLASTYSTTARRKNNAAAINSYMCPDHSYRGIEDYVKIFGYYHTLALICKRVTTYYVSKEPRQRIVGMTADDDGNPIPQYASEDTIVPVHIPLALYDLGHTASNMEFYAMVYLNGVKLDEANVSITGTRVDKVDGLTEIHFTYTPAFDDEIFWETDRDLLEITITPTLNNPISIKKGDYITVEVLPAPSGQTCIRTYRDEFEIAERTDDLNNGIIAFSPIGYSFGSKTGTSQVVRMSSDSTYINGKMLVANIDYTPFAEYPEDSDTYQFKPIVQNVGYLVNKTYNAASGKYLANTRYYKRRGRYMSQYDLLTTVPVGTNIDPKDLIYVASNNLMEVITTTDKMIASAKGFLIGDWIKWDGLAPFWFDNLSLLIVGGRVCSYFSHDYSGLRILDGNHENGEPFMVKTCVPESVIELMNVEGTDLESLDIEHLGKLRVYFDAQAAAITYKALIPHSHKVYSTYLLKIIQAMFDGFNPQEFPDPTATTPSTSTKEYFDFQMLKDPDAFKAQFARFDSLKANDVVFASEVDSSKGLASGDLKFLDVYPIYHNLQVGNRAYKAKIEYMLKMLMPSDDIRHREHINGY